MDQRENIWAIVFLLVMCAVIAFIIYDIFQTRYLSLAAFLLPFFLFVFNFVTGMGDFLPHQVKRGNLFVTDSGVVGTQIGSPKAEHGRKVTYKVAFKRSDLPKEVKREHEGWMSIFLDMFTGTTTIPVTASKELFTVVPSEDVENQKINNMIKFHGRLDNGVIRYGEKELLMQKLRAQGAVISTISTQLTELEKTIAQWSYLKIQDMDTMSQFFQKLSDRVKNIKIITRRGGSDIESIGQEV